MQPTEQPTTRPGWLEHLNSLTAFAHAIHARIGSFVQWLKRSPAKPEPPPPATPALKIARYGLVLMDPDGQVVWTGEWDSGGVFEFRPRQRLWVFCAYTNHSECETEISEYEIELMSEDGSIVERFNDSFGDSLIIPPGQSKQFPAEWRM
jgi:hypothetical protein